LPVVYLFLDGQYHAARQGTDEKEGVLSAYALLEDGRPVLLHLDMGPRESYDAWLSFLQDLTARGLQEPLLVILDGAPGLLKAVKRVWPRAWRQKCQVHRRIRTTNRLERLNGESRRRTKVIPRFPTERSCLTLLYASLVTASKRWRGVSMTAKIAQQLQALRQLSSADKQEAVA
jgi:putative transposase